MKRASKQKTPQQRLVEISEEDLKAVRGGCGPGHGHGHMRLAHFMGGMPQGPAPQGPAPQGPAPQSTMSGSSDSGQG
jgi:hypothetical protein